MLNQELLLGNNIVLHNFNKKRIHFFKGRAIFEINTQVFTGNELQEIIYFINYMIKNYGSNRIPIEIHLGTFSFHDKLVYVLLESVCYYLIVERKQEVTIRFRANHTIWSEGIRFSPLRFLDGDRKKIPQFVKSYKFDINKNHYRRIVELRKEQEKPEYLSVLMNDIFFFLQYNGFERNSCQELSEVISELVGNAIEHAESDCLVDLDVTTEYINSSTEKYCYGLNACVLNFSDRLFYELLKEKISTQKLLPERYKLISEARKHHSSFFSDAYNENDFFTIASFQHKISGSGRKTDTGGTGLTYLIKSLEEKSEGHWCYILTGNRVMFFRPEYMKYDDNKLIGFNQSQDFINAIPDISIFETIRTNLPGTAYNLNFALRKEG